jgi:hypothetical protein
MQIAIAIVVIALATPLVAQAECVSITLPEGQRYTGPVAKPTLAFSGTVTAMNSAEYSVSFRVDRVYKGQLRRETTLIVAPLTEGVGVRAFQTGEAYLVIVYDKVYVFTPKDVAETGIPAGTLGVTFGCIGGPVPLAYAKEELKRLGRGRAPRP